MVDGGDLINLDSDAIKTYVRRDGKGNSFVDLYASFAFRSPEKYKLYNLILHDLMNDDEINGSSIELCTLAMDLTLIVSFDLYVAGVSEDLEAGLADEHIRADIINAGQRRKKSAMDKYNDLKVSRMINDYLISVQKNEMINVTKIIEETEQRKKNKLDLYDI